MAGATGDRGRISVKLRWQGVVLAGLIGLGLLFRLVHLEQKVFWVDEVATAIRIAGHTRPELTELLSDGKPRTPADLLAYQQLAPGQSPLQTFAALSHSPEHAPLYFLLLRIWAGAFGSSVLALRSFSVLCGLLLLGAIFWLGKTLGAMAGIARPQLTGCLACGFTALSPLLIAYSQEARPYSLWLLLLTLNSALLLHALQANKIQTWLLYGGTLVLSLYTSLLTLVIAVGQALYVSLSRGLIWTSRRRFGWVLLATGITLLPWLGLIIHRWSAFQQNTTWMRLPLDGWAKLAIWFYTVAILYFDVPVVIQPIWIAAATLICATAVVATICFAFYWVYKNTSNAAYLFLLTLAFSLPVTLVLLELAVNGRFSTAPRYLLPFHLGAQLAVALLLGGGKHPGWQRAGIAGFLVVACLLSNLLHLETAPRYLKTRSLNNPAIAEAVNQAVNQANPNQATLLLAESQNTMDLLSLSHDLAPSTQIRILPPTALLAQLSQSQRLCAAHSAVFLFNPSPELRPQVQQRLVPAYQPRLLFPGEFALSLWRLPC